MQDFKEMMKGLTNIGWKAFSRPRGRSKRTWTEVVQKDCQARNL